MEIRIAVGAMSRFCALRVMNEKSINSNIKTRTLACLVVILSLLFVNQKAFATATKIISPIASGFVPRDLQVSWQPDSTAVVYYLLIGSNPGGSDIHANVYSPPTTTSETITIPEGNYLVESIDEIWITLFTVSALGYYPVTQYHLVSDIPPASSSEITSPTDGSTLTQAVNTLQWAWDESSEPSYFILYIGSSLGSMDLGVHPIAGSIRETSFVVPMNGNPVYLKLEGVQSLQKSDESMVTTLISDVAYQTIEISDSNNLLFHRRLLGRQ